MASLAGGKEVQFAQAGSDFVLVADSEGVWMRGRSNKLSTMAELQGFAKTMSEAWQEHCILLDAKLNQLTQNAAGH